MQAVAGILIGALGLGWAMRGSDLRVVGQSLAAAHYAWVLAALACVLGVALAKAARWSALYGVLGPPTFWESFSALIVAQMVNVVIPIRLGELVRVGLIKQSGQPATRTLSTIAIEKALDLAAAGLIAISVVALAASPAWLRERAPGMLLVGLVLVAGTLLVWRLRSGIERLLERALARVGWLPSRWKERLIGMARTLLLALGALTDWRSLLPVLAWTMLSWLLSILMMVALFAAFQLALPVTAAAVLVLAALLSNIFPSPPALVGVVHAIAVAVLGEYGVDRSVAFGFGVALNVVTVGPLIVLGGLALWQRVAASARWLGGRSVRGFWRDLL